MSLRIGILAQYLCAKIFRHQAASIHWYSITTKFLVSQNLGSPIFLEKKKNLPSRNFGDMGVVSFRKVALIIMCT